jgi:His-Xaa-Ser system protein HxsD
MAVAELRFDAESHSADAIQRAAYRFTGRCSLELKREGDELVCLLHTRNGSDEPDAGLAHDFRVEVLDQVLRERIRLETEGPRNLILSLAFSRTGLTGEPAE